MRAVVQRVASAAVSVDGETVGAIQDGLLVYLGVAVDDNPTDVSFLVDRVAGLRVFPDIEGKMNRDVQQAGGQVLVVSAFTTQADARKGRRPTFDRAARPAEALVLYESFCEGLCQRGLKVARGAFGEMMEVSSVNAGPVCILLDSRKLF